MKLKKVDAMQLEKIIFFLTVLLTHSLTRVECQTNPLPGQLQVIPIGGIFETDEEEGEKAFQFAIQRLNEDYNILPRSKFEGKIERVDAANSALAGKHVCGMLNSGVTAIFGPQSHEAASHVQSICDAFEIPHVETKWDHRIRKENYLINLYPHPLTLSRAFSDLVEAFGWDSYVIIYENDEGLFNLQDLIKASAPPKKRTLLRQLTDDYRQLFREILRETDITNIVLDCDESKIHQVLKQAQQVGLMTFKYSFIVTSLDLHTINLDDFKFAEVNITALRLVDPDRPEVKAALKASGGSSSNHPPRSRDRTSSQKSQVVTDHVPTIKTQTALMYDAVYLLGKALHVLDSSQRIDVKRLDCDATDTWPHGYSIINYMKMVQLQGLTGLIQFNTTGFRTDVSLDVIQLKDQYGLKKIGTWDSKFVSKFNWTRSTIKISREQVETLDITNRTFVVTTIMNNPFTMLARSEQPLIGNARYEGFAIDLLKRLSSLLGFNYIVKPVNDGNYGAKNKITGDWNGMIAEVLNGVADIAVADLTINKERQEALDFTMPFMNLGVSILFVEPSAKPPSLYSFLSPFSLDVWIYMAFSFLGVSIILYILARLTPYEWGNVHPCVTDPDELVNQFSISNSYWFTIGSIMQQGSDIAPKVTPYQWLSSRPCKDGPQELENDFTMLNTLWFSVGSMMQQGSDISPKAVSTRMIAGIWWFFTLIMVSSYTANLATFLIVQDLDETIKNLADLANQDKVKYGCVGSGSTASFFKDSPFELNQRIWKNILTSNAKHHVMVKNNKEGIEKVKNSQGLYAFFMESTVIEYTIERECQLAQVGGPMDSKGYGIALPKGSKYLQSFSSGILRLQEQGVLDELKRKWWKEERKENICATGGDGDVVKPLKLANVGGVFVVLVAGSLFAILLAILEFLWKSRELANTKGASYWDELMSELRFALKCRGDTKPVRKKLSVDIGNNGMGSNDLAKVLDLAVDSYGFPKLSNPINGTLDGGYT